MIRRPPRSTQSRSSAASDVYKRQVLHVSQELVERRADLAHLGVRVGVCRRDAVGEVHLTSVQGQLRDAGGGGGDAVELSQLTSDQRHAERPAQELSLIHISEPT